MLQLRKSLAAILVATTMLAAPAQALAETIQGALAKAYRNNSQLNSARAGVRVVDEGVAIAKSGFRPTISGTGSIDTAKRGAIRQTTGSFAVRIQQPLFDGFQTVNNTRRAEALVRAQREFLRNTEQNILFNAAAAYIAVIRDRQIAALTERNLAFLNEQVRAARSRFEVGEGTRTDVAQADASQAQAQAQAIAARANILSSEATYLQIIGERPGSLKSAPAVRQALPSNLEQAQAIALTEHPAIRSGLQSVDAALFAVKSAEGAMLPQVSANAGVSSSFTDTNGISSGLPGVSTGSDFERSDVASVGATLTIPIYQGGRVSAQVRQGKESVGQARIEVDVSRDQVRQALTAAWTGFKSAGEQVSALREVISANQLALNGVIEERNVGQRTTLDVLEAQATVLNAQIQLASAEAEVVVTSYGILQASGRLTVDRLGLGVEKHRPEEHYHAVKNKWHGTKTPDAR